MCIRDRVDTLAPGLMWCYVLKDDSGNYIIRENVVGDEADYVAKQNQSEDVRLLSCLLYTSPGFASPNS